MKFKLLVLLCQDFLGSRILPSSVMDITVAVEEPEYDGCSIGEEVHEDRGPKDPSKVSSFLSGLVMPPRVATGRPTLAMTLAVDLPTNPPI